MYEQKVVTGRGDITHNLLLYRKDISVDVKSFLEAAWMKQPVPHGKAITPLYMDITGDYGTKAPCVCISNAIVDGQFTFYALSPYSFDLDTPCYKRGPGFSRGPAYDHQRLSFISTTGTGAPRPG